MYVHLFGGEEAVMPFDMELDAQQKWTHEKPSHSALEIITKRIQETMGIEQKEPTSTALQYPIYS